ncbi:MAG: peptide-methionine (S)-S-oxide reductase MsrA [Planctomycetota bacterium]|nr:peptide-methionine (S)-S-oxide reductase MsrA [Planctomycetota bacterium]
MQKATFAAGCFWGVETAFRKIEGVVDVAVGYMGGGTENPTYKEVCTEQTGHAEVVQVDFDPDKVSFLQLLDTFWQCHDPTQLNRQGPDVGTQYRSAIFFHSPEQESEASAAKEQLVVNGKYSQPVATLVEPAAEFYRAEEYHQQYLAKRGMGSCHI